MNLFLDTVCGKTATTGTFTCAALKLFSIELPWANNKADVSCVPAGEFQLLPYFSPAHGQTWRLHNPKLGVWGSSTMAPEGMRTQVELHSANWCRQLLGCCALGLEGAPMLDPATGRVEPAVEQSVDAIAELRKLLDGASEEDILTVSRGGLYTAYPPIEVAA